MSDILTSHYNKLHQLCGEKLSPLRKTMVGLHMQHGEGGGTHGTYPNETALQFVMGYGGSL